jgi:hypothetical protein
MPFWDGSRWVDEPVENPRPHSIDTPLRDRIVTFITILALAVMAVPFLSTAGASSLVLAPSSGSSGTTVLVTGRGFVPHSKGTLVWDGASKLGDVHTTGDGAFTFSFVIPAAAAGDHSVAAQFPNGNGKLKRSSPAAPATVIFTVTGPTSTVAPSATASPTPAPVKPATSATPTPTGTPVPTATRSAAPSSTPVSTPVAVTTPAPAPPIPPTAGGERGFAYYYLWWSGQHWHDKLGSAYPYSASPLPLPASLDSSGCNPKSLYAGNQLTDVPVALESQDSPGVIEADMRQAASSGLTGFLVNWHGAGSTSQSVSSISYSGRLAESFASANRVKASGIPFDLWVSYEAAATLRSAAYITADITWLAGQFANNPAWDRSYGKPLLVWTGSRKYSTDVVRQVSAAVRDRVFLVGDESAGTLDATRLALFDGISYYWSSQDPYGNPQSFDQLAAMASQIHAAGKPWFAPLTPGYDSVLLGGSTCVPRNGGQTMRDLFAGNSRSGPQAWVIISWNEIAENSYVKPMQRYGSGYAALAGALLAGR